MRKYLSLLSVFSFLLLQGQAADLTLVKNGVSRAIIAIADDPDENEQLAVKELQMHLEEISGAIVDAVTIKVGGAKSFIAETKAAQKTPILIGRITRERLSKEFKKPPKRGAFVLQVADGAVRQPLFLPHLLEVCAHGL